jgi:hypothetical protein
LSFPDDLALGGSLGVVRLERPRSFAAINDLVSSWGAGLSRAHLARVCAAAVGICYPDAPRYPVDSGDPVAYGGRVFDFLLAKGVTPARVYEVGPALILEVSRLMPTEAEVVEAEDFTGPRGVASTG